MLKDSDKDLFIRQFDIKSHAVYDIRKEEMIEYQMKYSNSRHVQAMDLYAKEQELLNHSFTFILTTTNPGNSDDSCLFTLFKI